MLVLNSGLFRGPFVCLVGILFVVILVTQTNPVFSKQFVGGSGLQQLTQQCLVRVPVIGNKNYTDTIREIILDSTTNKPAWVRATGLFEYVNGTLVAVPVIGREYTGIVIEIILDDVTKKPAWVGAYTGLFEYVDGTLVAVPVIGRESTGFVNEIILDDITKKPVWVRAEEGLFKYVNGTLVAVPVRGTEGTGYFHEIIFDEITKKPTWARGWDLFEYVNGTMVAVPVIGNVHTSIVEEIIFDEITKKPTWVGARGLFEYVNGTLVTVPVTGKETTGRVTEIILDGITEKPAWVGAVEGLFEYVNGTLIAVPIYGNESTEGIRKIILDEITKKPAWVGARGLFEYVNKKLIAVPVIGKASTGTVIEIILDDVTKKPAWVGAGIGLFEYQNKTLVPVPVIGKKASTGPVYEIIFDDITKKPAWVRAGGGLFEYVNNTLVAVPVIGTESTGYVLQIIFDDITKKPAWVRAEVGLFEYVNNTLVAVPGRGNEHIGPIHEIIFDVRTKKPAWVQADHKLFESVNPSVKLVRVPSLQSPLSALQKNPVGPFQILLELEHPCRDAIESYVRLIDTGSGDRVTGWIATSNISNTKGLFIAGNSEESNTRIARFSPNDFDGSKLGAGSYQIQVRLTHKRDGQEIILPYGDEMRIGKHPVILWIVDFYSTASGKAFIVAIALLAILRIAGWIWYLISPLGFLRHTSAFSKAADLDLKVIKLPISGLIGAGLRHSDRVLDAWVKENHLSINNEWGSKDSVVIRSGYVSLPVTIEPMNNSSEPFAELESCLRARLDTLLPKILITGDGGCGKTALATWIGDRLLNDEDNSHPGRFRRVPVLLDHDLDDDVGLIDRVETILQNEYTVDWADRPLVVALLKQGRVLLILDRISELSDTTQSRFRPGHKDFPAMAYIMTSRTLPGVDGQAVQRLFPQLLSGVSLTKFVFEFQQKGEGNSWSNANKHDVCGRIERFFGERPTTVLLVKLALVAEHAGGKGALVSHGDLIRNYVLNLDKPLGPAVRPGDYDWPKPLNDAQLIAWTILDGDYHIREIPRETACKPLGDEALSSARIEYLVERLQIFQWHGAKTRLGASQDPVVEHLAALHLLETNKLEDTKYWEELGEKITRVTRKFVDSAASTSTEGFVRTLHKLASEKSAAHPILPYLAKSLQKMSGDPD